MDLEKLRARLSEIDRDIIERVAARQQVVEQIGSVKRTEGRPTRDFGREKQVIGAAAARAAELGLPAGLAESLMQSLIRSSLANQERARVAASAHGAGRQALVIGGAGKMGRWFVDFLDSQGFNVAVADPSGEVPGFVSVADWHDTDDVYAVTIVAAPLAATAPILDELGQAGRAGLIFDVASLKSPVSDSLRALAERGLEVTSVHPMFGPDTDLLSGRHILFLDVGVPKATAAARRLFESTMASQIEMPLEDHDRLIGYVLGLSHALNIAFFTALAKSGEAAPKLAELSSTTFDAQLEVARRVARESPDLYFEIQAANPYGLEPLRELGESVRLIGELVESGDRDAFVELMTEGRRYLERRG